MSVQAYADSPEASLPSAAAVDPPEGDAVEGRPIGDTPPSSAAAAANAGEAPPRASGEAAAETAAAAWSAEGVASSSSANVFAKVEFIFLSRAIAASRAFWRASFALSAPAVGAALLPPMAWSARAHPGSRRDASASTHLPMRELSSHSGSPRVPGAAPASALAMAELACSTIARRLSPACSRAYSAASSDVRSPCSRRIACPPVVPSACSLAGVHSSCCQKAAARASAEAASSSGDVSCTTRAPSSSRWMARSTQREAPECALGLYTPCRMSTRHTRSTVGVATSRRTRTKHGCTGEGAERCTLSVAGARRSAASMRSAAVWWSVRERWGNARL